MNAWTAAFWVTLLYGAPMIVLVAIFSKATANEKTIPLWMVFLPYVPVLNLVFVVILLLGYLALSLILPPH